MSLLLDALKKAAEAKNRQAAELNSESAGLVELVPEDPPRLVPVPPTGRIGGEHARPIEIAPAPLNVRAVDALATSPPTSPTLQPTIEPPVRARDTASPRPRPESARPSSPESLYDEFDETQQLDTDELRSELLGASQYSSPDHARNMFSSKAVRKPIRQRPSILLMLLIIVAVVGAAGWLYYGYGERQFALQRELARIRSSAPIQTDQARRQEAASANSAQNNVASPLVTRTVSAPQPRQPIVPVTPTAPESAVAASAPESRSGEESVAETAAPAPVSPAVSAARQPTASQIAALPAETRTVAAPRQPAAPASAAAPKPTPVQRASEANTGNAQLSFTRGQREAPLDALVRRGYEAYQQGRLAEAGAAYREALGADTNHRDALLGVAAVALRAGDGASAARYYQRLLNLNPRDPAALVGLQSLSQNADPAQLESELRILLEQVPESAPLHFALGSIYSRDQRWAAAQQAYFNAHRLDSGNPDYLYNLAVSLDNLGKRSAAAGFYQQALEAARQRAASFNQSAALARLDALQGEPR